MQWMINTQLGRRNLPPQQRIAVVKKFEKKIQEQAKITQGARTDLTSSSNGEKVITSTRTDKELAKLAGVGTVTVARFNKVKKEIKDLIETNIRQRGIGNPNPIKLSRCIKELERIYGIEHGGNHGNQYSMPNPKVSDLPTQEDLANMIGISVDTLNSKRQTLRLN